MTEDFRRVARNEAGQGTTSRSEQPLVDVKVRADSVIPAGQSQRHGWCAQGLQGRPPPCFGSGPNGRVTRFRIMTVDSGVVGRGRPRANSLPVRESPRTARTLGRAEANAWQVLRKARKHMKGFVDEERRGPPRTEELPPEEQRTAGSRKARWGPTSWFLVPNPKRQR